jgi:hypothetical protein
VVLPNLSYEWTVSNLDVFVAKATMDLAVSFGIPTSDFELLWTKVHSNNHGTVAGFAIIFKTGSKVDRTLQAVPDGSKTSSPSTVITTNNLGSLPSTAYVNPSQPLEVSSVSNVVPDSESDFGGSGGDSTSSASTLRATAAGTVTVVIVSAVVALLL